MPRVSEQHLAARRQQILDAARLCFTRNGFHATSMQDVIAEAGLSIGAVYRYFKSKEDLVTAIAEQVVRAASARLGDLLAASPPLPLEEALARTLAIVEPEMRPGGAFQLAIQVWGETFRNPRLAEFVERIYTGFRGHFVELARRAIAAGELPADADPAAVGSVLFGLIPGYGMQRVMLGTPDPATYLAGLSALLGAGRMRV